MTTENNTDLPSVSGVCKITYYKDGKELHSETLNHANLTAKQFHERCYLTSKEHKANSWLAEIVGADEAMCADYDAQESYNDAVNDIN